MATDTKEDHIEVEGRITTVLPGGVKTGMVRMGANLLEFVPTVLRKIKESGMGPVATVSWNGQEHTLVPEIIDSPELIFSVQNGKSKSTN